MIPQTNSAHADQVAIDNIKRWRAPGGAVMFVREVFKIEPDLWQVDFLNNYQDSMRSGAKACKGPGKTAALAWIGWHFLVCYPSPKIAATSITGDNLRDNLWAEMSKWQQKSELLSTQYTWKAERITLNDQPETWFMTARKWSQSADKEKQGLALAGLHADNILFLIDEAGGVPDAVVATAEAALANAGSEANPNAVAKLVIVGNPTHLAGPLYRACTSEASLWKMIEITGDPDDPKRSPRISVQWARDQIKKYGRDNSWVLVNVFGKFPPSSIDALLGPDDVQAAMDRVLGPESYMLEPKVLSVDVALQGGDETVISARQGPVIFRQKIIRMDDPKLIAGVVATCIKKFKPDAVFIDNTGGWGSGVISWLQHWGYAVTGVQFAGKAMDNVYANKRAEMHFEFQQWVKNGGCLPDDQKLKEECTAQTYTHYKDRLIMADKDQVKEILGRSPDRMDSCVISFAFPVQARSILGVPLDVQNQGGEKDYDPIGHAFPETREKEIDYNPISL